VNLIMGKEVVKELIQTDFNTETLKRELDLILPSGTKRSTIEADYKALKVLMGDDNTSDKTAQLIVERVRED
jgi:lipid-A-disaccharide synthase